MTHLFARTLATVALGATLGAQAQQAGDVMVRIGQATVMPQVSSGNLSAPSISGTKSDVSSASSMVAGLTYMYTDNISFDLPLALPFRHKIYGAGALAGTGQLAEVQSLPATVFAQYRFMSPHDTLRPYAGLGLTYAYFFNESGGSGLTGITNPGGSATKLRVDSQWTYTAQLGATLKLNPQWYVDVFYSVTPLKTKNTLSTGQTQDITLDPISYGVALAYRF